jgi:uncharacterized protein YutE (UPF0331/DUF86 family)
MVDPETRFREMLADLEALLDGLREKQGVSRQEYETDRDLQDIVERRLEKATQTCIDIGQVVCRLEGHEVGDSTNADVLARLVDIGVLPQSNRDEFVEIAGLRNVLAHRYRHIDSGEIYESYHDLARLEAFSEAIYLYVHEED